MPHAPDLSDAWSLGPLRLRNRVLLAPLAGIGNWFVRLQALRHGAGMAVSEMLSSHAIHHRNRRTCEEMLRIDPREQALGPVSIQLFGQDPTVMRSAAARVAQAGADAIDINMGCPVPKVCRTGAGASLLSDPALAVALARAAIEGSGGLPVTVKLRSGQRAGDATSGYRLAHALADAGVAAIAFHPRAAAIQHKGAPDYQLAARLAASLPVPVILSGGLREAAHIRRVFLDTGVSAVMLARGSLGNPWLFEQLLAGRTREASPEEVLAELDWLMQQAAVHLGAARAARYLRKFYPWYLARLPLPRQEQRLLQESLHHTETLADARRLLDPERLSLPLAA
jgi:tRNA-dihydrouridine synthase B